MKVDATQTTRSGSTFTLKQIIEPLRDHTIKVSDGAWALACSMAANADDPEITRADRAKFRSMAAHKKPRKAARENERLSRIATRFHERAEQEILREEAERLGIP